MSDFDLLTADILLPALMERHGEAAVYTPPEGGAGTSLVAALAPEQVEDQMVGDGHIVKRRVRDGTISTDPASEFGGVADPQLHATLQVLGTTYAVESVRSLSGQSAILHLVRAGTAELARKGYRQR